MIPIEDNKSKQKLIKILESAFKDNQKSHLLLPDGSSQKIEDKGKAYRMQEHHQKKAEDAYAALKHKQTTTFEPHTPS